jgi:hypothetical protein
MSLLEEELDEMIVRVARGRLPGRPMGGRFPRTARRRAPWIGHDACGCGTGCGGGCGCGCVSCGGAEAGGLPPPRAARGATSIAAAAGNTELSGWRGWSAPVRLSDLTAAQLAGPSSGAARRLNAFFSRGSRVYRITREGIDIDRPLNIGMTISNSIFERMRQHRRGPGGDPVVHGAIRSLAESQVIVQAAQLIRQHMHPRKAKFYENWLQIRERPLLYNPNTTTFESSNRFDHV